MIDDGSNDDPLLEVLAASQREGHLGSRPVVEVVEHARAFVRSLAIVSGKIADIGAGGGVPGLVVANDRPDLRVSLIDRRQKRVDLLERAIRRLGWTDRVAAICEDVDQLVDLHGTFDAVTARGFGPPEATVRVASQLVRSGGRIVISEPPDGDRWDPAFLDTVGVVRMDQSESTVVVFELQ